MVEVGAGIAGDPPHKVGAAPRNAQRQRQVLRHGKDRQRAADRFTRRTHDFQPVPDERADLLPDLHPCEAPEREIRLQSAIHFLDVDVDHSRLVLGHGELRLHRIKAKLGRGRLYSFAGPAVEHGIFANRERQFAAHPFEGARRLHPGSTGLDDDLAQAPLRQPH